jgi:hypothetical protein
MLFHEIYFSNPLDKLGFSYEKLKLNVSMEDMTFKDE